MINKEYLSVLTERERAIYILRNEFKRTLGEVGKQWGISRDRVHQIEMQAGRKIELFKKYGVKENKLKQKSISFWCHSEREIDGFQEIFDELQSKTIAKVVYESDGCCQPTVKITFLYKD